MLIYIYLFIVHVRKCTKVYDISVFLCSQCKCVLMCVYTCLCCKMLLHVIPVDVSCSVCSLKQALLSVMKLVESVYRSPNVPVCMQINFALNTKSERQVAPVMYLCPSNRSCSLYPEISSHLSDGIW